ncbi:hypothetical protein Taro_045893 [Colocasia esculenta]|uniref:Uncharacterized protein n=1 Tax=Colocasia esculenta TaxID=4460 RepID=A0A843WQR5_COLES|nr:hypothetical protein [Colocasia esculenta]
MDGCFSLRLVRNGSNGPTLGSPSLGISTGTSDFSVHLSEIRDLRNVGKTTCSSWPISFGAKGGVHRVSGEGSRASAWRATPLELRSITDTAERGAFFLASKGKPLPPSGKLHGVDDNIGKSKKILTSMSRRMSKNKWIIGSVIAVLVIAILLILYFKLSH